jgi:hypothetical protein
MHLKKMERFLRAWIDFVREDADPEPGFKSFELGDRED